jgi:hypothetical protein
VDAIPRCEIWAGDVMVHPNDPGSLDQSRNLIPRHQLLPLARVWVTSRDS